MIKCNNCGIEIDDNHTYCPLCGMSIVNNNNINIVNNNEINYIDNNMLVDAFIGNNANKIKDSKFSIWVLLFGGIYILYRKMWINAIILILISMLVSFILPFKLSLLINLGINLIIAFYFKKLYLKYVDSQVKKIREANSNLNQEALVNICKNKGGVSIVFPLVGIIIITVIFSIFVLIILNKVSNDMALADNGGTKGNLSDLKIEIPDMFKESKVKNINLLTYETDINSDNICSIYIAKYSDDYYKGVEDFFDKAVDTSITPTAERSDILETNINGTTWKYMTVMEDNVYEAYYMTIKNETIYSLNYSILYDADNKCHDEYQNIINSLSLN